MTDITIKVLTTQCPGMHLTRYEAEGLGGLIDRRLDQASNRRAPVDEVMALTGQYRNRHSDWNVKHFHSWYR